MHNTKSLLMCLALALLVLPVSVSCGQEEAQSRTQIASASEPQAGDIVADEAAGENAEDAVACTTEVMLCPDGSGVGRTGPNCEFKACPDASENTMEETQAEEIPTEASPSESSAEDFTPSFE